MHYNYEVGQKIKSFEDHDIPTGLIISDRFGWVWFRVIGDWKCLNRFPASDHKFMTIEYVPEGHNKVVQPKVGDTITHEQFAKLPVGSVVLYKDNSFSTFRNVYYVKDNNGGINFAGKGGHGDCTVAELSSRNGTLTILHLEES